MKLKQDDEFGNVTLITMIDKIFHENKIIDRITNGNLYIRF
nr:hypothetical protein [Mycoplasmopsis bovis]